MSETQTPDTRKRVLIVEDEGIVAYDIQRSLEDLDYRITDVVASGADAIRSVEATRPDLVLMDIRIQGDLDGIQTAEILKRRFVVPIVYLTAHGDGQTIERAKKTEPLAFLVKPFKKTELRSAVEIAFYRDQMERRLRERERWLSTLLGALTDGVIALDLTERVTFMNSAAEILSGRKATEIVDRPLAEVIQFVDDDDTNLGSLPWTHVATDGRGHRMLEGRIKDVTSGKVRPVTIWVSPVVDAGEMLGTVVVLTDSSERERLLLAEKQARRERRRSERAHAIVRERDAWMAVAAHELRTPLSALQLRLQSVHRELQREIEGSPIAAKMGMRLDGALRQTRRLTQLIEQLMDVSRILTGQLELAREEFDLAGAVRNILDDFREKAREAQCELRPHIEGDTRGSWDRSRIEQAFTNVLSNALKYGSGAPIEVTVEGRTSDVCLTVSDHGIGIPPDEMEKIFRRFERAEQARHYGGLGIGLYVAKHVVEAHGGAIRVKSRVGEGASFQIELPRLSDSVPPLPPSHTGSLG